MPSTIFMSYRRRGDSTGYAGRIADRLKRAFGEEEYFRDLDDIKPGTDFVDAIDEHMECCKVLLVIIGSDWLTLADAAGRRRLSDPRDWVRMEVAAALKRKALILPVLVGAATMPGEGDLPEELKLLARRQAIDLTDTRWDYDVEQLLNRIAETSGLQRRFSVPTAPRHPSQLPTLTPYFPVSTVKLAVMSIVTFGLYQIYWFYQHWTRERARTGEGLWPLPRAIFGVLFAYSLARRIRGQAVAVKVPTLESPGLLAVAYFLLNGASLLPNPYSLIWLVAFVPLLPIQGAANRINQQVAPAAPRNDAYSGANIVMIVFGGILLLLAVVGLLAS
jgi:hypothetical protein